jgi:hypothetical protein
MATFVALHWKHNPVLVYAVNGSLLALDLLFFASTSTKLFEGGWFPLLIAFVVAFLMLTWRKGEEILDTVRLEVREPTKEFVEHLNSNPRAHSQSDQSCKNLIEIALGTGMQDVELKPEGTGRRLQVFNSGFGEVRTRWVDEERNDGRRGNQFVQQFQPLRRAAARVRLNPTQRPQARS